MFLFRKLFCKDKNEEQRKVFVHHHLLKKTDSSVDNQPKLSFGSQRYFSQKNISNLAESEKVKASLEEELHPRIFEANQHDLKLYGSAQKEF